MKIKIEFLKVGCCYHPEFITIRGGAFHSCEFPALVALIYHPKYGHILFDTGYSEQFFQACQSFPYGLYRIITPISLPKEQYLLTQLKILNISAHDINHIIISHFHADHIAGLKDFPNAKFLCSKKSYMKINGLSGFKALFNAFLPKLLPTDFTARLQFVEDAAQIMLNENLAEFEYGFDIFGDNSLIIVELPGHAKGQIGLYIPDANTILVADSCWSSKAYRDNILPNKITYLIHDNAREYNSTLTKLHKLHLSSDIKIIPSHCKEIWGNK